MRAMLYGVLLTAGIFGWAAVCEAQPEPQPRPRRSSWLPSWLGGGKAEKTPEPKAEAAPVIKVSPAVLKVREQEELARRLEVCNRLREIAIQTKDTGLEDKAFQLQQRAFEIYQQRMAQLAAHGLVEDQALARRLGADRRQDARVLTNAQRAASQGRNSTRGEVP